MQYTVPNYYKEFSCTASECTDTCCAGWQIVIDEQTRKKYKKMKGSFGNRVRNSINFKESSFLQYDGRCAFLNENNLCDMYTEAGPSMLCRTCRMYPRHIEEFEDLKEISLSISCPEAAKIILGNKDKVRFLTKETKKTSSSAEEFDFILFTKLMDARDIMLNLLQDRAVPLKERIGMVIGYAHDLQSRLDRNQVFAMDEVNERYGGSGASEKLKKQLGQYESKGAERYHLIQKMIEDLSELEVLRDSWPAHIKEMKQCLYSEGLEVYEHWRSEFYESGSDWEMIGEQLMVYFMFTYMAGAVYDDNVYAKVKLSAVSTILIMEMFQSVFIKNDGAISFDEIVKEACAYSREVEHSDDNLNLLEEIYTSKDTYDIDAVLTCIMGSWI